MRDRIRFLLGDEIREIDRIDPSMTVLDWLRGPERRTGTKEGCNEGDCGACTIVVVRLENGELRHRAVNSCIQFVGTLDGCQLLTVEDLKRDGVLHPVQQAMVDMHGSQCGFCTPGFVMSLFAMTEEFAAPPSDDTINDILAGNLCRCTGYAPIIRAARRAYDLGASGCGRSADKPIGARLKELEDGETVCIGDGARTFYAPSSVADLAQILLDHPQATIVAGSTDVGLWVTKQMRQLDPIVWVGRVRELQQISDTADAVEIGAGVSYTDATAYLAALYPDIGEVFRRLGSVQIRNAGTVGGNIANGSPIGDASPALIAVGATLHLRKGQRQRSMPLEDFFLAYGKQDRAQSEFVERITVPKPGPSTRYRAYKISKRFDQDISAVMGAFCLRIEAGRIAEARIAFGGMAATPKRASFAEAALRGRSWDDAAVSAAQRALEKDFKPISDMRSSASYRLQVAKNLFARLRAETDGSGFETRLVGERRLSHD